MGLGRSRMCGRAARGGDMDTAGADMPAWEMCRTGGGCRAVKEMQAKTSRDGIGADRRELGEASQRVRRGFEAWMVREAGNALGGMVSSLPRGLMLVCGRCETNARELGCQGGIMDGRTRRRWSTRLGKDTGGSKVASGAQLSTLSCLSRSVRVGFRLAAEMRDEHRGYQLLSV